MRCVSDNLSTSISIQKPPWRTSDERRQWHCDRRQGPDKIVRRPRGRARFVDAGEAGVDLRLPRPERLGQDDDHPYPLRPAHARQRRGHLPRLRHQARRRKDQAPGRLHDPALQPLSGSLCPRKPRIRRAPIRPSRCTRRRARHDQADRALGARGTARGRALRRLEAAAGVGRLHIAQSETAVAGRADRRRRPEGAARFLERDSCTGGRRSHRAGLDTLHGRGRALSRDRLYRLWPSARARHRGRGNREIRADDLHRDGRGPERAYGCAHWQAWSRHGGAVRHVAARLRPRRRRARGQHRAVARKKRTALAQIIAVTGRRVYRIDEPFQGQFPMSAVDHPEPQHAIRERFGFWRRSYAMLIKEFIQLKRDRVSFAMIVMLPVMQLLLFGYAINTTPHNLPSAVLLQEDTDLARSILKALENTAYFRFLYEVHDVDDFDNLLKSGKVLFGVEIPRGFERAVRRGDKPALLVAADATDPVAASSALGALGTLVQTALAHDLHTGDPLDPPFEIRAHARYNPAASSRLNIVPGLVGTILTMTMLIFTALSVTRETERGTMESLLSMPITPLEIMLGKIAPYVLIGFFQASLIVVAGVALFN